MASSVLALKFEKCQHSQEHRVITACPSTELISDIFRSRRTDHSKTCRVTIRASVNSDGAGSFEVGAGLSVADVVGLGVKFLTFECQGDPEDTVAEIASRAADHATTKAINAFEVLMSKGRSLPKKKNSSARVKSGLTRKDELYNDLVQDFKEKGLDFPKSVAETDGAYFIQVLCNVLWYLSNQQQTINSAALRKKDVLPIPDTYNGFVGYNEVKRKKLKEDPLSASCLHSNSQAIYSILMKPYTNSSPEWVIETENITNLAKCLDAYANHLDAVNKESKKNQSLDHPVRTIDEHATIQYQKKTPFGVVKPQYKKLDEAIKVSELLTLIVFDESVHLESPFENPKQRWRFFDDLQLSSPIYIIRFNPGGSIVSTVCIAKVQPNRGEPEMLIKGTQMFQKARPYLKEFHTRQQKTQFRERLRNVTHILPSVADMIYKELTYDAAAACHPATAERVRLIFLGEPGLIADMRHINPGRPVEKFDTFFEHLADIVEQKTAADDRRHNVAHLSEWMSLKELISDAAKKCPPDTLVPSTSLVRLQFAPRNPYTRVALNFTSKIQVQYKIQRRQLRAAHPDDHYCAAQFRYFRERAVELIGKAAVVFCDDKAKVPLGEPGCPISTGVRGKKSLAPVGTTLSAKDHDMNMASVTPSVTLLCDVPEAVDKSFVRGTVTTVVNDSVFQSSNPFRHAAALVKILQNQAENPKVLMKFTDGGTDQRNTLEAVKCASICMFLEMNLDMLIHGRCAPGQSWINPAERIMSILNIGLQNCALERKACDEDIEKLIKRCGSMANIRELAEKQPQIKDKYTESVEEAMSIIRNRFLRLSLKDKPIQAIDPVTTEDIDILQRHMREHFPDLDPLKLQKIHTNKSDMYKKWVEKHCRQRQYTFQIRKCNDGNCCLPSSPEDLSWLPDPQEDINNPGHYMAYSEVRGKETVDNRPSLKVNTQKVKPPTKKVTKTAAHRVHNVEAIEDPEGEDENVELVEEPKFGDSQLCTAQHARTSTVCVECRKPRVLYSKHALTDRQNVTLVILLSDFEYSCGAPITPPSHNLHGKVMTRANISCAMPVEIPYYSSSVGRADICAHCAAENSVICSELKACYKTVLPMCDDCKLEGKTPVTSRPFGKNK